MEKISVFAASLCAAALLAASPCRGQALAQMATAAPSALGEGALYMLAGNDAFRTGAAARFNITRLSDLGVQLGYDRIDEEGGIGGGLDFKIALLERRENLPFGLALDASGGWIRYDHRHRFEFGFGVLASGAIATSAGATIEPYLSFIVAVNRYESRASSTCDPPGALCPDAGDRTETNMRLRLGARFPVSRDAQIHIEASIEDRSLFGAGFNIVF